MEVNSAINMYLSLIEEINDRMFYLGCICERIYSDSDTIITKMDVENCCLQIRIVLESIAMGTLVVNKDLFEEVSDKVRKMYHAKYILRDVERLNPNFLPRPIVPELSLMEDGSYGMATVTEGVLTKELFEKIYDKCGAMLHATNPFSSSKDYLHYFDEIPLWAEYIFNTLKNHIVVFPGGGDAFTVHINGPLEKAACVVLKAAT